ncbi:unnamed protein product [Cunninghamella echinulata]
MNLPRDLFDLENYEPLKLRVPFDIIENIKVQLKTTFMFIVNDLEKTTKTRQLDNYILNGFFGYILKAFSDTILVIIIVKNEHGYQLNYGQMMMKLFKAWDNNTNIKSPVYGIVTSGIDWRWWKFDGDHFSTIIVSIQLNRTIYSSIPTITCKIYAIIIDSWLNYSLPIPLDIKTLLTNQLWSGKNNSDAIKAFEHLKVHILKERPFDTTREWYIRYNQM